MQQPKKWGGFNNTYSNSECRSIKQCRSINCLVLNSGSLCSGCSYSCSVPEYNGASTIVPEYKKCRSLKCVILLQPEHTLRLPKLLQQVKLSYPSAGEQVRLYPSQKMSIQNKIAGASNIFMDSIKILCKALLGFLSAAKPIIMFYT